MECLIDDVVRSKIFSQITRDHRVIHFTHDIGMSILRKFSVGSGSPRVWIKIDVNTSQRSCLCGASSARFRAKIVARRACRQGSFFENNVRHPIRPGRRVTFSLLQKGTNVAWANRSFKIKLKAESGRGLIHF